MLPGAPGKPGTTLGWVLGTGLAAVLGGDGRHRGRCEVVSARAVLRLAVP
ncbi:MAG: hypothetical protein JO242_11450, partial [Streptosporangiaceae bacterium]|nr:hypothetical protein [Streptosporangiaceae bacterium]